MTERALPLAAVEASIRPGRSAPATPMLATRSKSRRLTSGSQACDEDEE
jgi:hypothetical protein